MRKVLGIIVGLLLPTLALASDVTYLSNTKTAIISGDTNFWLYEQVSRTFRDEEVDTVYMYGDGGSLDYGLGIGREIKKEGVRLIVPSTKKCSSACAFAALAADDLSIDGELLFHSPWIKEISPHFNIQTFMDYMSLQNVGVAAYIMEVGYSISLMEHILKKTNPCKFWVMSDYEELKVFHKPLQPHKRIEEHIVYNFYESCDYPPKVTF